MYSRREHHGIVWIDLENPTRAEVESVAAQFGIVPLVAEELLLPSSKPRAEFYGSYCYLVFHFPALRHSHTSKEQEVDFIVGKDFIITTHYEMVDPLHKFSKVFEVNAVLEKSEIGDHAGFMLFYMLKKLYKSVEHELEYLYRELGLIEEHIFSDHQTEMVAAISRTARDLLNLRQTIEPHREMLHTLESDAAQLFGSDFNQYLRALSDEYYRVHNHIMRATESLHELRETNNSLLTTRQNETMKVFTILAFFTFPLSLIVEIFSTDAQSTPIIGGHYDFWIILAIMATTAILMYWYFHRKRWL